MSLIASLQEGSASSRRCLTRPSRECLAWLGTRRASWWNRWRCWLVDLRQPSTLAIYRQLGDDAMPPFGVVLGKEFLKLQRRGGTTGERARRWAWPPPESALSEPRHGQHRSRRLPRAAEAKVCCRGSLSNSSLAAGAPGLAAERLRNRLPLWIRVRR